MRGEKATRSCAACGTELTRLVSQAKGQNWYCNARCQASHMPPPATVSREPNPLRGQKDTRPCVKCGQPVTRYLSPSTVGRPWACSKRCNMLVRSRGEVMSGTWKQPRKPRRGGTVPCDQCGTPFYRQPAYIAQGRRLCSTACANLSKIKTPIVKACLHCGAEMTLKPSQSARQFCSKACEATAKIKRPTGREHNGRPVLVNAQGYLTVYEPTHPAAGRNGRVLEHRLVMESVLGRYLTTEEHVDHIDQDKTNNDPSNLQVMSPMAHSQKTNADKERARARLLAELAAYQEKYGPLESE